MELSWTDFAKVEMRAGTILSAEGLPNARKPAYVLHIDFGPLGILKSSAQVTDLYSPDDLVGTQVIAVTNFGVKQIGSITSQCLVLAAIDSSGIATLLRPDRPVPDGSAIA